MVPQHKGGTEMGRWVLKKEFGFASCDKDAPLFVRMARRVYKDQRKRCNNMNCAAYKNYGGKGIAVEYTSTDLAHWLKKKLTIKIKNRIAKGEVFHVGRVDHSKNYRLDNIELVTRQENLKERNDRLGGPNRKKVVCRCKVTGAVMAEYDSLAEAAKKEGITAAAMTWRTKHGIQTKTNSRFVFEVAQ